MTVSGRNNLLPLLRTLPRLSFAFARIARIARARRGTLGGRLATGYQQGLSSRLLNLDLEGDREAWDPFFFRCRQLLIATSPSKTKWPNARKVHETPHSLDWVTCFVSP